MLRSLVADGLLPFRYLVADCLYGNSPEFLDCIGICISKSP